MFLEFCSAQPGAFSLGVSHVVSEMVPGAGSSYRLPHSHVWQLMLAIGQNVHPLTVRGAWPPQSTAAGFQRQTFSENQAEAVLSFMT